MQKLIKLTDTHYIVVDDSEIKVGDWCYSVSNGLIVEPNKKAIDTINSKPMEGIKFLKITHSTQPLGKPIAFTNAFESELSLSINGLHDTVIENWVCKKLSLSEVEEAINGYSIYQKALDFAITSKIYIDDEKTHDEVAESLISFHKELVKDKLFTVEDMLNFSWWLNKNLGQYSSDENAHFELKYFNQWKKLNPPKTEWDVTFDEQGKISLAL